MKIGCPTVAVTKLQIFALFFISEWEGVGIVKTKNPNSGEKCTCLNKKIAKKIPSGGDGMDAGLLCRAEWNT